MNIAGKTTLGDCWLSPRKRNRNRYGYCTGNDGKRYRAHRVVLQMFAGLLPPHIAACHRCDTPACWRPDHLFAGTWKQNSEDAAIKGRSKHPTGNLCHRGHDLSLPENIYLHEPRAPGKAGGRECLLCRQLRDNTRSARQAQAEGRIYRPRDGFCKKGLHDLNDPVNVYLSKGEKTCKPCKLKRGHPSRTHKTRTADGLPEPRKPAA